MTAKLSQKGIKEAKRTNKKKEVSGRVVQRLTEYLTILVELAKSEEFVNSIELSKIMDTTSAQVRKDLSTFGEFGVRGKGYEIVVLIDIIENILSINVMNNVAIVGHGRMGELISSNSKILGKGFQIVGVFDKDSKKIGTQIETLGITIKDMDDLKEEAKKLKIDAVILAVTKEHAQIVADRIIMSGIHAILNMTTYKLEVPKGVAVMNIDISAKLQELNYWRKQVKFDKTK